MKARRWPVEEYRNLADVFVRYRGHMRTMVLAFSTALAILTSFGAAQSGGHNAGVDHRGDQAMGFSHEKTRHHFLLLKDGGAIQIVPKDPHDSVSVAAIRDHLKMIASMFQQGNFDLPMFIHDTKVPGTDVMKRRRILIRYTYQVIPRGAAVRISSSDRRCILAIHAFLKFQIRDHRTGDSGIVQKQP